MSLNIGLTGYKWWFMNHDLHPSISLYSLYSLCRYWATWYAAQQLPPACGWCVHPSNTLPPPLRHPPPGGVHWTGAEWRSGDQEPGAGGETSQQRGDTGGSTRGVMVASSGETLALCPVSFKWQSSYYIDIMKYMNKIVMSLRRKHYINMISTRFGWLLLCREEF